MSGRDQRSSSRLHSMRGQHQDSDSDDDDDASSVQQQQLTTAMTRTTAFTGELVGNRRERQKTMVTTTTPAKTLEKLAVQEKQKERARIILPPQAAAHTWNPAYDDPYFNPAGHLTFGKRGRRSILRTTRASTPPAAAAIEQDPLLETICDHLQRFRYKCGLVVNHPQVQLFVVVLIAMNALMMGIATYPIINEDPVLDSVFELADQVFLILFTIELLMQFLYRGFRLFRSGWLVFDFVVIVISWSFNQLRIIRAFRVFRALRLITRIKVMKTLVVALFGVIPRMFGIGVLLTLVSYIFGVMFTQLWGDMYKLKQTDADYFGTLDRTLFTLFQILTLDNWADICRQVVVVHKLAWIPIVIFVVATGFVVVNLIIAVICDAISALNEDDKARFHGKYDASAEENKSQDDYMDDDDMDDESMASGEISYASQSRQQRRTRKKDEPPEDFQIQLDMLEDRVDVMAKLQDRIMYTLELLNRRLVDVAAQDIVQGQTAQVN